MTSNAAIWLYDNPNKTSHANTKPRKHQTHKHQTPKRKISAPAKLGICVSGTQTKRCSDKTLALRSHPARSNGRSNGSLPCGMTGRTRWLAPGCLLQTTKGLQKDGSSVLVVTASSHHLIEGKSVMTCSGIFLDDRVAEGRVRSRKLG